MNREVIKEGFSSWFKENTPKEGFTDNTTFTIQFLIDAWNNGYNKAKEEVKQDLMMKLKDEGIVKPLKDSISSNKKLSSQEQQELCAWIECAMDFGVNLDECAKELEEVKKANEWHNLKTEKPPLRKKVLWCIDNELWLGQLCESWIDFDEWDLDSVSFNDYEIAWKEIVLPELPKEIE